MAGRKIMRNQIFITVDGGLIQNVTVSADLSDVEITVIDFDTEGSSDTKKTPRGEDAIIDQEPTNVIGDGDLEFWEGILKARKN